MKTLIIDNYDSFTYNLYQMLAEVNGEPPIVIHNDTYQYDELVQFEFDQIVLSPGPGHPGVDADFGICRDILMYAAVPILGVCLGHQGLCHAFGGHIVHAPMPMHGRISRVKHNGDPLFQSIPHEFNVVRYHSLVVQHPLPDCLDVIATTEPDLIMAVRHRTKPFWGVQYHPESICSEYGQQLFLNFKQLTESYQQTKSSKKVSSKRVPEISFKTVAAPQVFTHQIFVEKRAYYDPKMVFERLFRHKKNVIWLDSSLVKPGQSRFSFMGGLGGPLSYALTYDVKTQTITRLQHAVKTVIRMPIFDYLQQELANIRVDKLDVPFEFWGGFVGYLGYELYQDTMPICAAHEAPHPDAQLLFLDRVIVFDHQDKTVYLVALTERNQQFQAIQWFDEVKRQEHTFQDISPPLGYKNSSIVSSKSMASFTTLKSDSIDDAFRVNRATYLKNIERCLMHIRDGESYEICLTNQLKMKTKIDAFAYHCMLRQSNPAPYAALLFFDGLAVVSASIERFLFIDAQGGVETKPIKGTLARGKTPRDDRQQIAKLQNDIKFRAENLMIVDLLRNDLGKVCEIGSIHVPKLMHAETFATVHQLVSTIRGQLKHTSSSIDCVKAAFPGGSMTGAPKIRTIEIIHALEPEARNIYSGSIGYLSVNGAVDLSVVIRTAIVTDDAVSIGVGGAIIALSSPEEEFEEIELKAMSLIDALHKVFEVMV